MSRELLLMGTWIPWGRWWSSLAPARAALVVAARARLCAQLSNEGRDGMKRIRRKYSGKMWIYSGIVFSIVAAGLSNLAAQSFTTATVQGTVYTASGTPASGTLQLSWPAFTTAAGQPIAAGRTTVTIGSDGFVSVNLAPNVGATPAGLYYTAVYHLSDGTTSTEYWVVPAAAQVTLAQVRAQVMPAAQAVQAVSKAYVDQSIQELTQSLLTAGGGNLSGPLYLSGDPTAPTQAADKHYVDTVFGGALSIDGGVLQGPVTAPEIGGVYEADQVPGVDFGGRLQACINGLNATYGGVCDARNFTGSQSMGANVTIATANTTVYLPCATIATSSSIVIPAGVRNVTLHGCASRGASAASGSQGGTVFLYSGSAAMIEVGDGSYAADTTGFHMDNLAINTTAATVSTAEAIAVWRTQELSLSGLYLMGNANQTGMTLDGTGNYTGGTIQDVQLTGFQTAINAVGHQAANPATTDWVNASTFVRVHIDCPTTNGNPTTGTTGINLQAGDGNTFTGGDVEGCATALHLGANARNNTIVGLRNENSTSQVTADAGSAYNSWTTGGTMFTGALSDAGTRNSFLDTFHRSFNALNGDWYGSQQDATLTNHFRLGIGSGNERGLLNRYQTDSGYRWTTGLSDAASGQQYYQVLDELNNVNRLSIGQYNQGQSSTNNQTAINSAGTGAVVLNGSNNAGTGGVVVGSGGAASLTVATISNAGNAQFNGTLQVNGASTFVNSTAVRNSLDAEIDAFLQAGATTPQKESFAYRDYNGASQWYMVKDANNNWSLNSAVGGLDSFKAYQSTNSGDTYVNASNATGHIRLNYETGAGTETDIYSGGGTMDAAFLGPGAIKFPGLASASGTNCAGLDNSGYLKNSGFPCGTATNVAAPGLTFRDNSVQTSSQQGALTGSANDGIARAAASAAQSTANAALPGNGATSTGAGTSNAVNFPGILNVGGATIPSGYPAGSLAAGCSIVSLEKDARCYGAKGDGTTDNVAAFNAWFAAMASVPGSRGVLVPGTYNLNTAVASPPTLTNASHVGISADGAQIVNTAPMSYATGTVSVTNGSNAVTGVGTGWASYMTGQWFIVGTVAGAVSTVNSPTSITLASNWTGTTQSGAAYQIPFTFPMVQISNGVDVSWTGGTFTDNAAYDDRSHLGAGVIAISGGSNVTVTKTTVKNFGWAGVAVYNSMNPNITGNTFIGPGIGNVGTTVAVVPFLSNYNIGVLLEYSTNSGQGGPGSSYFNAGGTVALNHISNCSQGIVVGDGWTGVILSNNNIKNVAQHCVYSTVGGGSMIGNVCTDPFSNGFKQNADVINEQTLISGNTVDVQTPGYGHGSGVLVTDEYASSDRYPSVNAGGNQIDGMVGYGMYFGLTTSNVIDEVNAHGNTILNIFGPGIVAYDDNADLFTGNTISYTTGPGIVSKPNTNGSADIRGGNKLKTTNMVLAFDPPTVAALDSAIMIQPMAGSFGPQTASVNDTSVVPGVYPSWVASALPPQNEHIEASISGTNYVFRSMTSGVTGSVAPSWTVPYMGAGYTTFTGTVTWSSGITVTATFTLNSTNYIQWGTPGTSISSSGTWPNPVCAWSAECGYLLSGTLSPGTATASGTATFFVQVSGNQVTAIKFWQPPLIADGSNGATWVYVGPAAAPDYAVYAYGSNSANAAVGLTPSNNNFGPAAGYNKAQYVSDGRSLAPALPVSVVGKISAPATCGGTSACGTSPGTQVGSIAIPSGALDANGTLVIDANMATCSAAGTPYSGCAATNAGSCTYVFYLSASPTGSTGSTVGTTLPVNAGKVGILHFNIQAQGSTSSERGSGWEVYNAGTSFTGFSPPSVLSLNFATTNYYLNAFASDTTTSDVCGVEQLRVELHP